MSADHNRAVVRAAFDAWARAEGDFFEILADDVHWTITGSSAFAGTYRSRTEFLEHTIGPLHARLAEPLRPVVQSLVAEGEWVVALWHGHATALDGEPYDNTYSWHLRLRDGKVVEVTAFLDSRALDELLDRVAAPG